MDQLDWGSHGMVYKITDDIVLKAPLCFDFGKPLPEQTERDLRCLKRKSEGALEGFERERAVYNLLAKSPPHPNIVQCILSTERGIFLERMQMPLQVRITQSEPLISLNTKFRWLTELTSATAWLEQLGFVHGDLRPMNILVNRSDNLKLVDFDSAVKIGENLRSFTDPFWIEKADGSLNEAGHKSEQFAVGSCVYFIFHGHEPEIKPGRDQITFPDTRSAPCDTIIKSCWDGAYPKMSDLARAASWERFKRVGFFSIVANNLYKTILRLWESGFILEQQETSPSSNVENLRAFCQEYVKKQRHKGSNSLQS